MHLSRSLIAVGVLICFWARTPVALADTVDEILTKIDANLTKVKDQTYEGELSVIRDEKTIKSIKFNAKLKGLVMKLIKFTAPGDVRGMTVLTTAEEHMYVYLPSYKRVRRVAAHVRNQGFMGTDISPDDMGATSFSEGWNGKLISENNDSWILELAPKTGNESSYARIRATVLKKYGGVAKLEYFSDQNKMIKTQERSEWKTFGPITIPTLFVVQDLLTGSKTEMRFLNCKVNTGLPESAFTKRAILRAD